MKETINYYYNIYPDEIVQINGGCYFYYNDYKYYFVITSNEENEVNYLVNVSNNLYKKNILIDTFIITKDNKFYVSLNEKNYVLLRVNAIESDVFTLRDLIWFNNAYKKDIMTVVPYDEIWGSKVDMFEEEVGDFNIDYPIIQESFNYYVGLCENAISYYVDIKESEDLKDIKVSICHKRLNSYMYSGLINNPLNFTFDYSIRDIALYIQTKFFDNSLDFQEVIEVLRKLNRVESRMLFCRLLYPVYYFDVLKSVLTNEESESGVLKYVNKSEDYELLLFDIFNLIDKKYKIPRIEWLQNKWTK